MFNKIKERILFVALAIGAVYFFSMYLYNHFTTYGDTLTAVPGSENLYGFQWITVYAGAIAVTILALGFVGVILWAIYKDRHGRG